MKPLLSESQDNQSLQLLGRASVQVVHDLKNQINGLKLYATFLRKRLEKSDRPQDELDTINKLIAGLDRSATDLSLIGQFGQPVELKKHEADLTKIAEDVTQRLNAAPPVTGPLQANFVIDGDGADLSGKFDADSFGQALTWISQATSKLGHLGPQVHIKLMRDNGNHAIIEWPINDPTTHDPFKSFAGSDGIKMALAARIVEAHGGSAERANDRLRVRVPLNS